jgi:Arc/MetJ-type ribon-helix-helix transcriptional regulator
MPKRVPDDSASKVTIKIPRALYNRLREIIEGSGFDSVTDFVVYVLRDLAASERGKTGVSTGVGDQGKEGLTQQEIEAVRKRLKSLGYL